MRPMGVGMCLSLMAAVPNPEVRFRVCGLGLSEAYGRLPPSVTGSTEVVFPRGRGDPENRINGAGEPGEAPPSHTWRGLSRIPSMVYRPRRSRQRHAEKGHKRARPRARGTWPAVAASGEQFAQGRHGLLEARERRAGQPGADLTAPRGHVQDARPDRRAGLEV